jgi:hypothetical protein
VREDIPSSEIPTGTSTAGYDPRDDVGRLRRIAVERVVNLTALYVERFTTVWCPTEAVVSFPFGVKICILLLGTSAAATNKTRQTKSPGMMMKFFTLYLLSKEHLGKNPIKYYPHHTRKFHRCQAIFLLANTIFIASQEPHSSLFKF